MADSPGGREGGRVNVRVVPDSSRFRDELLADLRRIEASTRITIGARVDAVGMRREVDRAVTAASATAKKLHVRADVDTDQLDGFTAAISRVDKAMGRSGGTPGRYKLYAAVGAGATLATPGLLALAGSLAEATKAGLLLPAALMGAATGIGALAVGFRGVGTALKDSGDAKKYAEALDNLAPSARKATEAMVALKGQLRDLRMSVQTALFAGMSQEITRLGGSLIPVVERGLTATAKQANAAAKAFVDFASSAKTVTDLDTTFGNISLGFRNLVPAVQPFLGAMRDIGTVGSSFLPGLSSSLATATKRFGAFIDNARQTGELRQWIQDGLDAARDLGSVLGSAAKTLAGFSRAARNAGGGLLSGLAETLKRISDTVNGPAFQSGLTSFFKGLQGGFAALSYAMPALGDALAALGPPLGALATGVGQGLGQAIKAVTPSIVTLAPAITDLVLAFTKLATGAIDLIGPLLTNIASAARFVVQDVPGATVAISALLLALGGKSVAGMVGLGGALTKVTTGLKGLVKESAAIGRLKVGFAAADVATANAFAGKLGAVGAVAAKTGFSVEGLKSGFAKLGLAGVAVGAVAYGVQLRIEAMKKAHDNASEAASKLKSAMDASKASMFDFAAANQNAVKELRGLAKQNQKSYLVQIGMQLITTEGMTPKQAFAALKRLAETAGITLPIDLDEKSLTNIGVQLDALRVAGKQIASELDRNPFGRMALGAQGTKESMDSVAKAAVAAFKADNFAGGVAQIAAFEQGLRESGMSAKAQSSAMNYVNDQLLKFSEIGGLSTSNTYKLRDSLDQLSRSASTPEPLRKYAQAVLDASGGAEDLSSAVAKVAAEQPVLASSASTAAKALQNQKSEAQRLVASLDAVAAATQRSIGGNIGLRAAQAGAIQSSVDLGKSIKENGTSFDITTAKGRNNVGAMSSLASSFAQAADETIKWGKEHGRSSGQVSQDLVKLRGQLVRAMEQAGLSREAAKKLADQYLKLPKKVTAEARFEKKKAESAVGAFSQLLRNTTSGLARDARSDGVSIGKNVADGLKEGMRIRESAVRQQAEYLSFLTTRAIAAKAEVRSPSRVTMRIGEYIGDGLIVGMRNRLGSVRDAARRLAQGALREIAESTTELPQSMVGLGSSYVRLRDQIAQTASTYAVANARLSEAKEHTRALEQKLEKLKNAHERSANAEKLSTAAKKAANAERKQQVASLNKLVEGAQKAQERAQAAADRASAAADKAKSAAAETAQALIASVRSQADALISEMNDFRSRMADTIAGGAVDLTKLWGGTDGAAGSLAELQTNLTAQRDAVVRFANELKSLAAQGADKQLISLIAGMGPDSGSVLARQILEGGGTAIEGLDQLLKEISDAAGSGAQALTEKFYQPGVDSMKQLIAGLKKKFPELRNALTTIADEVSRVLQGILLDAATANQVLAGITNVQVPAARVQAPATRTGIVGSLTNATSKATSFADAAYAAAMVDGLRKVETATKGVTAAVGASNTGAVVNKRKGVS